MKALVLLLPRLAGMLAALMVDRAVPGRAKLLLAALAVAMTIFAFIEARKPHPWSAPAKAPAA